MSSWIDTEPVMKVSDLIGGFLTSLGLILFVIVLHLMTINEAGVNNTVLNSTFKIFLGVIVFILTMGVIYLLWFMLRWLAYMAYTPRWIKEEQKLAKRR